MLVDLVRFHLLLPEVATRRDLSDPGTINAVAAQVKDHGRLMLLRTLTEADSIATGSTAWTEWKARLVDDLTSRVASTLIGHPDATPARRRSAWQEAVLEESRRGGRLALVINKESDDVETVAVAVPDRPGLFSILAGALAVVGAEVLAADVWTTDDGYAIDVFRTTRRLGGETNWRKLEALIAGGLDGTVDLHAEIDKRSKSYARANESSAPTRLHLRVS